MGGVASQRPVTAAAIDVTRRRGRAHPAVHLIVVDHHVVRAHQIVDTLLSRSEYLAAFLELNKPDVAVLHSDAIANDGRRENFKSLLA